MARGAVGKRGPEEFRGFRLADVIVQTYPCDESRDMRLDPERFLETRTKLV